MRFYKNTIEVLCPYCEEGFELDIPLVEDLIKDILKND